MLRRRVLPAVIALILVVGAVAFADLTAGTKAPNFTLPGIDGKSFNLSSAFAEPGKVVVLDIWATWCPPCRAEIPYLVDLNKKFKGKPVMIVGVSVDSDKNKVAEFAKSQGITYTILHDANGNKLGGPYKVKGVPATYVIDKDGVVRFAHSGFPRDPADGKKEAAAIEREVNSLLAK